MIPQNFIDDLLNRTDIVEVVGQHVQLKNAGNNFQGLCPFHREKTPSFSVSATKQFYHCFGCSAHGNALSFIMNHLGYDFPQAVEALASRVGLEVPSESASVVSTEQKSKRVAMTDLMLQAARFYKKNLKHNPGAIQYLQGRGITGKIAAKYQLGFSHDNYQGLAKVFDFYYDQAEVLDEIGLTKSNEHGKRYDRFRNRLMFPIKNTKNEVVGFGGRVLGQAEPKYLNSPESPLFSKGEEVYGLFEAQKAIRDAGYVLVTEGYMDVLALVQGGFENAVATLGTSVTSTHVQKLKKYTKRLFFAFDGDNAGQKAAWRALEACLPFVNESFSALFIVLPAGHDPDSYIREHGHQGMQAQVNKAMPLSEFLVARLRSAYHLHSVEERASAVAFLRPLLEKVPKSAYQFGLMQQLAQVLNYTQPQLESLLTLGHQSLKDNQTFADSKTSRLKPSNQFNRPRGVKQQSQKSPLFTMAVRLVRMPELHERCNPIINLISETENAGQEAGFLIQLIQQIKRGAFSNESSVVKNANEPYQQWLGSVLAESDKLGSSIDLEAELNDCVYVCCEHWFKTELNRLSKIQSLNEKDRQWYQMCLQQFQKLKQNRVNPL